jgi:hypothetical protein
MGMVRFYSRVLGLAFRGGWASVARALVFYASLAIVLERKFLGSIMQVSLSADTLLLCCAAIAIVWGVLRAPYLVFDEEKKRANVAEKKIKGNLKFSRKVQKEDEGGHYSVCVTVKNTSRSEKLQDCYCEIVELQNDAGDVIKRQFPLGPRIQERAKSGGRFGLDQGAAKDIPIFEIDQLRGNSFYIIRAGTEKVSLGFGVYTARVRGYGDSGQHDEITVHADFRTFAFTVE